MGKSGGFRWSGFLLLVVALLVLGQAPAAKAQAVTQSADSRPIDKVQAQIEAAGAYGFTAVIEQTIIPRPIAANIGKTEERVDF